MPHLSTLVRLAGFRLIEAGLPENLDVDCQPSLSMRCILEIERSAVPAGLVHMLQLASKTGATLAGKRVSSFPGTSPTVLYHPRVTPPSFSSTFPDGFVLRFREIRIGFQRFNVCRQGACALVNGAWRVALSPILRALVVPV